MLFAHPWLLWGLGLVSVPIVIHLLNRRRFQVVRWAAMEFLLQANRKNRRRVRLEHLLILLLRCLAMALIALAVSRPVATSGALAGLPGVGDPVERVVLLDDSGSMGHRTGRTTAWDRARQVVKRLVEDLEREDKGDLLTIVRASRPDVPDLLQGAARNERTKAALRALADAEPAPLGLDAPRLVERAVRRIVDDPQGPRQRVIYVVTDLRRRDWVGEGDVLRALGEALRKAPPEVRVLLVDAGDDETRNLGVTALEPTEKLAMVGVPVELVVRVANRGQAPVFDVPLLLEAGESRIPLPPIERIDAGQEAVARHRYTFPAAGVHALSVRLPDDALPLDDVRHVALEVRERLRVLLVEGDPSDDGGPLGGEADLLRLALAPPGDVLTGIEPVVVGADALRETDLSGYDAVVACNLEAWPPERVADLERFVQRGGGLALFVGDLVDEAAWARDLYKSGQGLLPCALGRRVEVEREDEAPQLDAPEGDHPLTQVFTGDRNPFLRRVRARVRLACRLTEADAASRVVLRLAEPERTPFLVEKPFGAGRVALFNTTADLAWSSWPKDPSYIVTTQELVRLLAPAATAGRNLACGEPLERAINPARTWPRATVEVPGQEAPTELHAEPRAGSEALWLSLPETRRAGVYVLRLEPRGADPVREPFAVNPDPAEGDLARADADQVTAALEGLPVRVVEPGAEGDVLTQSDGSRTELWRACLLLLTVALGLEQVLAWRAARHTQVASGEEVGA